MAMPGERRQSVLHPGRRPAPRVVCARRNAMGDSRNAGTPRMSPQWAMVMARFDDMSRALARLEGRLDDSDRETRSEMADLRDQIQRTRDEVAQAGRILDDSRAAGDPDIAARLEEVRARLEAVENTRKGDVHSVLMDAAPRAASEAMRKAPGETWAALSIQGKIGVASTLVALAGTLIAGVVDGAPKVATFVVRVVQAIAAAK